MISCGIDTIELNRFDNWDKYNIDRLKKIFTINEITYCFEITSKTKERLAARFCAKEACYKALNILLKEPINLFTFFKIAEVKKDLSGAPKLEIDFTKIKLKKGILIKNILLSITHTKTTATALVIIV